MALLDPTYQTKLVKFSDYVSQLVFLKKAWKPENKAYIESQANKLRWQAALAGFDLKMLETEATKKNKQDPSKIDWKAFESQTIASINAATELGKLKVLAKQGGLTVAKEQAQKIRLNAAYNGLDLNEIELMAGQYSDTKHKEPAASYTKAAKADMGEAEYAAQLLRNAEKAKSIASSNMTDAQKKTASNKLHNDSQNLRADALKDGLNLWNIEKLYMPSVTGHAWSQADYDNAKGYIDKLYQTAGKDPKKVAVPSRSSGGSKNDFAFTSPLRKRTMYGETFSGADMLVFMAFPNMPPIQVGTATTVSVTTYREKKQFRTMGRVSTRGITKGPRTVSGKIIMTVINEHFVETLKNTVPYLAQYTTLKMDELPSFDMLISMGNEYGGSAMMVINGITIVDEQKTLSIEELFTENIFTYLARDYQPLRAVESDISKPYKPLEWYSYKFREQGSELIGKFKLDSIQLSKQSANLSKLLPDPRYSEEWTYVENGKVDLADEESRKEQAFHEIMKKIDKMPPEVRGLFIQILDGNNKPIRSGKIRVKFDNSTYDGTTNPFTNKDEMIPLSGYEDNMAEFEFGNSKAIKSGDGKYYGQLLSEGNGYPGGEKFTVEFEGTSPAGKKWYVTKKGAVDGATMSPVWTANAQYKKPANPDDSAPYEMWVNQVKDTTKTDKYPTSWYQFDGKVSNNMPNKVDVTFKNYREKCPYKAVSGDDVFIGVTITKGSTLVKGQNVFYTWEMWTDFARQISDPNQRMMLDRLNPKILTSADNSGSGAPSTRSYQTTADGSNYMKLSQIVEWGGMNGKIIHYNDLPLATIVKVYAVYEDPNGKKHYAQWMIRKVNAKMDA